MFSSEPPPPPHPPTPSLALSLLSTPAYNKLFLFCFFLLQCVTDAMLAIAKATSNIPFSDFMQQRQNQADDLTEQVNLEGAVPEDWVAAV